MSVVKSETDTFKVGGFLHLTPTIRVNTCRSESSGEEFILKGYIKQEIGQSIMWKQIDQEKKILTCFRHPAIATYVESFHDPLFFYVMTEYFSVESLNSMITTQTVSEQRIRRIFNQLLDLTEYLHENGVALRDIKLESVYVDDNDHIKVTDFTSSIFVTNAVQTISNDFIFTSNSAPEMVAMRPYEPFFTDIWCLGIILYTLFTKEIPWKSTERNTFLLEMKSKPLSRKPSIPVSCYDLISKMVVMDPHRRISIHQIRSHYWMNKEAQVFYHQRTNLPTLNQSKKLISSGAVAASCFAFKFNPYIANLHAHSNIVKSSAKLINLPESKTSRLPPGDSAKPVIVQ